MSITAPVHFDLKMILSAEPPKIIINPPTYDELFRTAVEKKAIIVSQLSDYKFAVRRVIEDEDISKQILSVDISPTIVDVNFRPHRVDLGGGHFKFFGSFEKNVEGQFKTYSRWIKGYINIPESPNSHTTWGYVKD